MSYNKLLRFETRESKPILPTVKRVQDGDIKMLWAPSAIIKYAQYYGGLFDYTYPTPDEWPVANTLIRMPRVVRIFGLLSPVKYSPDYFDIGRDEPFLKGRAVLTELEAYIKAHYKNLYLNFEPQNTNSYAVLLRPPLELVVPIVENKIARAKFAGLRVLNLVFLNSFAGVTGRPVNQIGPENGTTIQGEATFLTDNYSFFPQYGTYIFSDFTDCQYYENDERPRLAAVRYAILTPQSVYKLGLNPGMDPGETPITKQYTLRAIYDSAPAQIQSILDAAINDPDAVNPPTYNFTDLVDMQIKRVDGVTQFEVAVIEYEIFGTSPPDTHNEELYHLWLPETLQYVKAVNRPTVQYRGELPYKSLTMQLLLDLITGFFDDTDMRVPIVLKAK